MGNLILRVEDIEVGIPTIDLVFPALNLDSSFVGKAVALGRSNVPGLWSVVAVGRFIALEQSESASCIRIDTLFHLNLPLSAVSASTATADSDFTPLDFAIIDDDAVEQLITRNALDYSQPQEERALSVTEAGIWGAEGGQAVGHLELVPQDRSLFYRVAQAYTWECCFLHYSESAHAGRRRDGVVLAIDPPHWSQGTVSDAIFVNPILAFPFREGLVAIGDDYEILRSRDLSAGLRTILDITNPKALLALPEAYEDWPDLSALERHRRRFGY